MMRLTAGTLFFLAFATSTIMLLANPDSPSAPIIEVRTVNSAVEIEGGDGDAVSALDPSQVTFRNSGGRIVVEPARPDDGTPLRLHVSRRSSLRVITSNAAIRVNGVSGRMDLDTSNGAIIVRNSGVVEIRAHSSNGAIEISVPRGLNADLSARTTNGRIRSEVEVTATRSGETFLEGRIGSGGAKIGLLTSNGSIQLSTAGDRERVDSTFRPGEVR